jgi:release factor glutamine methyltransferase
MSGALPPEAGCDRLSQALHPEGPCVAGAELLRWRREQLARGGRRSDLDWLLREEGGLDWPTLQRLRIDPGRVVNLRVGLESLEHLWFRHCEHHEPLQYLVGRCPWRDLELAVAPGVLIPRQETELLPDLAQRLCGSTPGCWADLGTGSGCLAVALARQWPDAKGFAVDRSPEALRQAGLNLQRCVPDQRVKLLPGDWWTPLQPWWGHLDLVVSNPPYVPTQVWASLEPVVHRHEPRLALDGGADGLASLRRIVRDAPHALAPGGWLVLEHHHDQSAAVLRLLQEAQLQEVAAHADLEGQARFAVARRSPAPSPVSSSPCIPRADSP